METENTLLVTVHPGHGGQDNGASYNGRLEKDDNLRIALAVQKELLAQGVQVQMTRDTDVSMPLQECVQMANRANSDLFLSLHRNSYTEPTASTNGVEIAIYLTAPETSVGKAAEAVLAELEKAGIQSNRGVQRGNSYVLRKAAMPAMLLEMGYIINEIDNKLFDEKLSQYAAAIAKGILRYFGVSYNPALRHHMPAPQTAPFTSVWPMPEKARPMPEPVWPMHEKARPMPEPVWPMPDKARPMPEPVWPMPEKARTMPEVFKPDLETGMAKSGWSEMAVREPTKAVPEAVRPTAHKQVWKLPETAQPVRQKQARSAAEPVQPKAKPTRQMQKPAEQPPAPPYASAKANQSVMEGQRLLNERFGVNTPLSGSYDTMTRKDALRALQYELNRSAKASLAVDGVLGAKTRAALPKLKEGSRGKLVLLLQLLLLMRGYSPGAPDEIFGPRTKSAVQLYQRDHYLIPDGIAGPLLFSSLLSA